MSKNFAISARPNEGTEPSVSTTGMLASSDVGRMVEPERSAAGMSLGIVVATFNQAITEKLLHGAVQAFLAFGGVRTGITVVRVPGSFEIPLAAKVLAASATVDAVVAIGAVIRGGTSHYELVCQEAARGIAEAGLQTGVPVTFGVITTENFDQALERAGDSASNNKGAEATLAAIEMVHVLRAFRGRNT